MYFYLSKGNIHNVIFGKILSNYVTNITKIF